MSKTKLSFRLISIEEFDVSKVVFLEPRKEAVPIAQNSFGIRVTLAYRHENGQMGKLLIRGPRMRTTKGFEPSRKMGSFYIGATVQALATGGEDWNYPGAAMFVEKMTALNKVIDEYTRGNAVVRKLLPPPKKANVSIEERVLESNPIVWHPVETTEGENGEVKTEVNYNLSRVCLGVNEFKKDGERVFTTKFKYAGKPLNVKIPEMNWGFVFEPAIIMDSVYIKSDGAVSISTKIAEGNLFKKLETQSSILPDSDYEGDIDEGLLSMTNDTSSLAKMVSTKSEIDAMEGLDCLSNDLKTL